jgi:hypothetical protein
MYRLRVKNKMGRKRTPESEKKSNVWIRLPNPVIWELEKEGKPKDVIERLILEYFQNKTKNTKI